MTHAVRVWDLPTRLFHWLLAACIVGSVVTGHIGGGLMEWHARIGYAVLSLLLFRLVWGFAGGHWSRFATFVYGPGSVAAYLRGQPHPDHLVGHTPLGALSVFAMLMLLLAQVASGLVSSDEISFYAPLNRFVSDAQAALATRYHKRVGQWIIVALVLLHIGAIVYYRTRRHQDLVGPMLRGDKQLTQPARPSRDDAASRIAAAALFALCAGFVAWLVGLGAAG